MQQNLHPDVHGHRGARGTHPENTIQGFLHAIEKGCDYLEMDVVVTADRKVVVSHEPWMEPAICLDPYGDRIPAAQARSHNIHRMTLDEVQRYDCGSMPDPRFPDQEQMVAFKPSLAEVVEAADEHALLSGMAMPGFNIEIKSDPAWYGEFQPEPAEYVRIVLGTIDSLGIGPRCIIQSFDPAILEEVRRTMASIPVALLVEKSTDVTKELARLSFKPDIYSPEFHLVDEKVLKQLRELDIELFVWTVNEKEDIKRMLDLGVDAIISDHPARVIDLLSDRE